MRCTCIHCCRPYRPRCIGIMGTRKQQRIHASTNSCASCSCAVEHLAVLASQNEEATIQKTIVGTCAVSHATGVNPFGLIGSKSPLSLRAKEADLSHTGHPSFGDGGSACVLADAVQENYESKPEAVDLLTGAEAVTECRLLLRVRLITAMSG